MAEKSQNAGVLSSRDLPGGIRVRNRLLTAKICPRSGERRRDLLSTKRPAASGRQDRDERLLARLLCSPIILWSRSLRDRSVMDLLRSQVAAAAAFLLRSLPPGLRERIKAALGALGHEPGWAHRLRARNLAQTRKKLDILVEAIVERLEVASFQGFAGAACLEFGSGHLLSEALIYHLAGAARTVAIDHYRILQEAEVPRALDGIDGDALVRALARWDDPVAIRARLDALKARTDWTLAGLRSIGIDYVAPYDLAASPLAGESFDLISSLSVLEHVPPAIAPALLTNLLAMLRPGGTMVHNIHLEDHRDIDGAPFAFLAADTDWTEADYDSRGNRLRASDWVRMAAAIPGGAVARVEPLFKAGALLPLDIDLAFRSYNSADLRTSRIILVVHSSVLSEAGRDRPLTTGFPGVTAAGNSSPTPAGM